MPWWSVAGLLARGGLERCPVATACRLEPSAVGRRGSRRRRCRSKGRH